MLTDDMNAQRGFIDWYENHFRTAKTWTSLDLLMHIYLVDVSKVVVRSELIWLPYETCTRSHGPREGDGGRNERYGGGPSRRNRGYKKKEMTNRLRKYLRLSQTIR